MDEAVTAYVAESAASAPPPRGLPLSLQSPSRQSATSVRVFPSTANTAVAGSADDWDEAGVPIAPSSSHSEEEGPPLSELEAQMHGDVVAQESSGSARAVRRTSTVADDEADDPTSEALPELDALVARLSAEVRETLDELFRARFVTVKKLPRRVFSTAVKNK